MQQKVFKYCVMLLSKKTNEMIPVTLQKTFKQIQVRYPTGYSDGNFKELKLDLTLRRYVVSTQGPRL